MGISAGGGDQYTTKSDINVTPLVDIVLVLLIIFLVTMPVMMRQISVEVPRKVQEDEDTTLASKQISLLVKYEGEVIINDGTKDETVNRTELRATLEVMLEKLKSEKVVFVDFEDDVPYGEAVTVMDTIKGAGAEKVAIKIREKDQGQSSESE